MSVPEANPAPLQAVFLSEAVPPFVVVNGVLTDAYGMAVITEPNSGGT